MLASVVVRLNREDVEYAIIGGIAVAMHGHVRATRDLDFLVAASDAEKAHAILSEMGFSPRQRTKVFGNYVRDYFHLDVLLTQGEETQAMLKRAGIVRFGRFESKLVDVPGIIALKLQAIENNPSRPNDEGDIRELLRRHHQHVDMELVRDYFKIFGKESELDAILANF